MIYQTFAPSATLAPYVRFFWNLEDNMNKLPYVYRSLADNCTEIIFHYKGVFKNLQPEDTLSPLSLIHAQSCFHRRFKTDDEFGIFGVYLYPFAIPALLNIPASELSNKLFSIDSVLGTASRDLEDRVMQAKDSGARVNVLNNFFEGLLRKNKNKDLNIQQAIRWATHSGGQISVKQLADQFCLSERQLERKFKEHSGFGPKAYLRIVRFQKAIKEYNPVCASLSEVAHLCGYYDQSHFIHDFKQFSGYHPSHYFSSTRNDVNLTNDKDVGNLQLLL